jgi:hypothetical protein
LQDALNYACNAIYISYCGVVKIAQHTMEGNRNKNRTRHIMATLPKVIKYDPGVNIIRVQYKRIQLVMQTTKFNSFANIKSPVEIQ